MNSRLYSRLLDISQALKPRLQTGNKFHVSFLVRKGRVAHIGANDYRKAHLAHRFGEYTSHKFSKDEYRPSLHSECVLAIHAGMEDWSGFDLVNVRIDNNGRAALSKCCPNCQRVVNALRPNHIFYSVDEGRYGESGAEENVGEIL